MKKILLSVSLVFSLVFLSTQLNAQTADEIIGKYITAIGGKDKWSQVKSMKVNGYIEVQGIKINFTQQAVHGTGVRVDAEFQGQKIIDITTPTMGWSQNPFGGKSTLQPISGEELQQKLDELDTIIEKDELQINNSVNTMKNCYDIILENEDYTIGKVIEYFLYTKFYETKILTFCGFKKEHPHDDFSIIRVAYADAIEKSTIKGHFKECLEDAKQILTRLKKDFLKLMKN